MEFDSFLNILEACWVGRGLASVRSALFANDLAAGRLERPVEEATVLDLHHLFVVDRSALARPEVEAFRDWIVAETGR